MHEKINKPKGRSTAEIKIEAVSVLVIVAFLGFFVGLDVPINNICNGQQPLNCKCILGLGRLVFLTSKER